MRRRGGFPTVGIPVLSPEHDPLEFFGQATEISFVVGLLNAFQAKVKSLLRDVDSGRILLHLDCHVCMIRGRSRMALSFTPPESPQWDSSAKPPEPGKVPPA